MRPGVWFVRAACALLVVAGVSDTAVAQETVLISRASGPDGVKGNAPTPGTNGLGPAPVSGDGRRIVFTSTATNLHPDDTDNRPDLFVRDVQTGETILVSRASGVDGVKANGTVSFAPAISADGRFVSFHSTARNLHPDDRDTVSDVYVRDLETHETILVSRASGAAGVKGNQGSLDSSLSADGRFVVFRSVATNLHPDDDDIPGSTGVGLSDIYVRDMLTHETILVSRADGPAGVKGHGASLIPTISADGRFVAFSSDAPNLDPGDIDGISDIFVRDVLANETILVSRASGADGVKGDGDCFGAKIAAGGRFVAFASDGANLDPGDTDGIRDVFVRDLLTHETRLVSRADGPAGAKGNGESIYTSISADGRFVAFASLAANLHRDDTDSSRDAFVRDVQTGETILASRASGPAGAKGNNTSIFSGISADGRFVAFASGATNLHPDDTDTIQDVFVRDLLFVPPASWQTILGKSLTVKDPKPGVDPTKRTIVGSASEKSSPNTLVGDPTLAGSAGGAILEVFANGATPSAQEFVLAQGTDTRGKPFWSGTASKGFKYKDSKGARGPVKSVTIKRSGSGSFSIKAVVSGKNGPVEVVPPNPGTDGCMALDLGIDPAEVGDRYSVRFGPEGLVKNVGDKLFRVTKPALEDHCPGGSVTTTTAAPTTTTSTTTSTTAPPTTTTTSTTTSTTSSTTTSTTTTSSTSTTTSSTTTTTSSTTTTTMSGSPSGAFLTPPADLLD